VATEIDVGGGGHEAPPGSFDVQAFRSSIANNYHREAHYDMVIGMPRALLRNVEGDYSQQIRQTHQRLHFEIESANIPGIAFGTDEIRLQGVGPFDRKPYVPIFDTVSVLVRSDSEGRIYDFFQSWMKLIINFDSRHGMEGPTGFTQIPGGQAATVYEVGYKADYKSESVINVYDKVGGQPTLQLVLTDCYPIHLGNAPLSWSSAEIIKFPVTFTFTDWHQSRNIRSGLPTANSTNQTG
jgi:hypothetical protein